MYVIINTHIHTHTHTHTHTQAIKDLEGKLAELKAASDWENMTFQDQVCVCVCVCVCVLVSEHCACV